MSESFRFYFFAFLIALLLLGGFILLLSVLFSRRQVKNRAEKESLKNQFQQTLLQSQLEIQSQTMQQLSAELHDNIGHLATILKINLISINLNNLDQAREKIDYTIELNRQLINDIKSISLSVNGDRLNKLGLPKALEQDVERINRSAILQANLTTDDEIPALDPNVAIIIYRMCQEVINNILKHAKASELNISLFKVQNILTLVIADNGVGFNSKSNELTGSGLLNLQHRANLINAELAINSVPGNGTEVRISLLT
jgi:signal transduction histidine kinase